MAKAKEAAAPVAEEVKTTAVATQETTGSTAIAEYDYGDDAGGGLQDIDKSEFKIPMLRILDPKSPQCKPVQNGGLPGAKGGAIINMGTNEIYDGERGLMFVPCARDHNFVEFLKRNEDGSGGGFIGIHAPDADLVLELQAKHGKFGKLPVPDTEHELSESFYLTGIAFPIEVDGSIGPSFKAVIAFASTQIKKYQSFITRAMGIKYKVSGDKVITPPLWAHKWHLRTTYESKGANSWFGWTITLFEKNADKSEAPSIQSRLSTKDAIYIEAKDFANMINEGKAKVDFSKTDTGAAKEGDIPM